MGNRGQLGLRTILAALVVVIAVSLAVIVVDQFDQSLGTPDSTALSTSQQDVLTGFADMTSLIGPLLLVAIAVVIIGLVRRLQGGS
jgi:type II secretory pathway component PulF